MPLRYEELVGGSGNEAFNANAYVAMIGLQGADDFGGTSALAIGGSGNDYYYIAVPAIVTVLDRSGANDVLVAPGIGFARESTRAITIESRHLFLFDTVSLQGAILLDWQQPASAVEVFVLSGTMYSQVQFAAAIAAYPRYEGNFTWEGAAQENYFALGAGETGAAIEESLAYYRATSIAMENPAFTVADAAAGTNDTIAAVPYSGPVAHVDLQFIGGGDGEVVIGTVFSDFINAAGGNDAVDGGLGDDVIDGGIGSNFLSGGAGRDIFFLDGRGGGATWSTITDWEPGEQLSLWGWLPGISTATWSANDGTPGWTGATMHCDLNGDGVVETSVTWTGRSQTDLPAASAFDGLLWFV